MHWLSFFKISLTFIVILYCWFLYSLILFRKEENYNKSYYRPVSIVIPCYNEPYGLLKDCIESCINAEGKHEVILVNNNSNEASCIKAINEYRKNPKVKVLDEPRQGKRFAHSCGIKNAKYPFVVFIDSDTIISKNSLKEMILPFQDRKVGGVSGQIKLANKKENLITRAIDSMFWTSCNIFRRATASANFMQVIPGALGCYRKKDLLRFEEEYLNQEFLGVKCSISDDRFITMRLQTREGKKIKYREKAIGYTHMPKTMRGFWKTLIRWKKGAIREIFLLWKEPKSKAKMLFFDTEFNYIIFNLIFIFKILFIITLIYNLIFNFSIYLILSVLIWVTIMNIFWNAYMVINNPKEFPYKIIYSLLNEFFWSFSYIKALIDIRKQGVWGTR